MKQKVEVSKNENSSKDGEDESVNLESNIDVINVEMEKNKKGKKKKLHQSVGSDSLELTKALGDRKEVSDGRELLDGNITHKFESQGKERKEKKRHKFAQEAASLDSTTSELHGGRRNMIEGNHDKIESQSKERKKDKKRHKVTQEASSLDTMDELYGDRSNMIERNRDNMAPAKGDKRKLNVDVFKAEGGNRDDKKRKKRKRDKEHIAAKLESPRNERKKRKKEHDFDARVASLETMDERLGNESTRIGKNGGEGNSTKSGERDAEMEDHSTDIEGGSQARRKPESAKNWSKEKGHDEAQRARNLSEKSTPKGKSKRVSFADDVEVEVFSPYDGMDDEEAGQEELSDGKNNKEDGQVRGKRFSFEEDEMVKQAVLDYISAHNLGEGGLEMVLHCKEHCKEYPEIKNCWKEIGSALPWRPRASVYHRAHTLFERDESRSWSKDECEFVRRFCEKNGPDWKTLGKTLGKHRIHVKDLWRRIYLPNKKKGKWSQEEYQNLFDLVNLDLRLKAFQEKKSKHGMLRDNIPWTAISQKLQTRADSTCCTKWYNQLTSPMVAEGKWFDTDDYRLLKALYDLDACCMEDVDWDDLLEHRPGYVCRQRWNQMVKHLGEHGNKAFSEQVEILTHRYCPELLEAREAYDSKPVVP